MNIWQGRRVRLRAVEPSDWESHWQWDQDSEIARHLDRIPFPASQARTRQWAEQAALRRPEDDAFHWQIETLGRELAGSISTHSCDPRNGTFKYGVAIRSEYQRQGFASEAILLVLRFFFHELRYQKVTADVYSYNQPSINIHRRLGFQLEGQLRRMIYTKGTYHDMLLFGITREEFDALHLTSLGEHDA